MKKSQLFGLLDSAWRKKSFRSILTLHKFPHL
jgi:hypothetical protein